MSAEENKERRRNFMSEQKTAAEMVAEAKGHVENLTPEQLVAEVERGDMILNFHTKA